MFIANVMLIIVGILIGFFAIHFKKVIEKILAFIWGAFCAMLVLLLIRGLYEFEFDPTTVVTMLVIGLFFMGISDVIQKLLAFLNGFFMAFLLVVVFCIAYDVGETDGVLITAAVLGVLVGLLSLPLIDYMYMISTAVLGGFLVSRVVVGYLDVWEFDVVVMWLGLVMSVLGASNQFHFYYRMQRMSRTAAEPEQGALPTFRTEEELPKDHQEILDAEKFQCICPQCGRRYDTKHDFCTQCGTALKRVCPYCGHELHKDSHFCGQCGNVVSDE